MNVRMDSMTATQTPSVMIQTEASIANVIMGTREVVIMGIVQMSTSVREAIIIVI